MTNKPKEPGSSNEPVVNEERMRAVEAVAAFIADGATGTALSIAGRIVAIVERSRASRTGDRREFRVYDVATAISRACAPEGERLDEDLIAAHIDVELDRVFRLRASTPSPAQPNVEKCGECGKGEPFALICAACWSLFYKINPAQPSCPWPRGNCICQPQAIESSAQASTPYYDEVRRAVDQAGIADNFMCGVLTAEIDRLRAEIAQARESSAQADPFLGDAERERRAVALEPESLTVGQLNQAVRDLRELNYQLRLKAQSDPSVSFEAKLFAFSFHDDTQGVTSVDCWLSNERSGDFVIPAEVAEQLESATYRVTFTRIGDISKTLASVDSSTRKEGE